MVWLHRYVHGAQCRTFTVSHYYTKSGVFEVDEGITTPHYRTLSKMFLFNWRHEPNHARKLHGCREGNLFRQMNQSDADADWTNPEAWIPKLS